MSPNQVVCIITQSHLCRNPRVLKEAIALANAGYRVNIVTGIISSELYRQDLSSIKSYPNIRITKVVDLSLPSLPSFTDRLLNKLGRMLVSKFKIENSLSLGYGTNHYYKKAKTIKADLYICHQELATYIGTKLIKAGFKVAFDLEDWYSEDLLPAARAGRPINLLRQTESATLNKGVFCITTSKVLAKKLSQTYSCPIPTAIYNVFASPDVDLNKPKAFSNPLKFFWFSQTIGTGRGLEQFITISKAFKNKVEIHLLGNITSQYRELLNSILPAQHKLYFHELVEESKLAAKIAGFDIGLALELDSPMSRNYTITNKFFQYIQSGLPVIASETAGQIEGFEQFKPGFMLPQNPLVTDVNKLEPWLNNTAALQSAREKAIEMASVFNWQTESKKLLNLVKRALEK
jgi:glycosyltransferase involved in cell wall biosynthesis